MALFQVEDGKLVVDRRRDPQFQPHRFSFSSLQVAELEQQGGVRKVIDAAELIETLQVDQAELEAECDALRRQEKGSGFD